MVLTPEAVCLKEDDCINVQQAVLAHCGGTMKNRIAILDVWEGYKDRQDPSGDCIANFRSKLGINYLDYATAYYPWLNTSIIQDSDISFANVNNPDILITVLNAEIASAFKELDALSAEQLNSGGNKLKAAKKQQMLDEVAKLTVEQSEAEKNLAAQNPVLYQPHLQKCAGKHPASAKPAATRRINGGDLHHGG
ncbi:hypothetical protein OS21_36190 [Dickeya oryzae]